MSQRFASSSSPSQDFENRAAGVAMLLLRVTLLGTLLAFIGVMGLSTWRVLHG